VRTLVISPLIRKGVIDKTEYDHTSVLATVQRKLFGMGNLTEPRQGRERLGRSCRSRHPDRHAGDPATDRPINPNRSIAKTMMTKPA